MRPIFLNREGSGKLKCCALGLILAMIVPFITQYLKNHMINLVQVLKMVGEMSLA